MDGDSLSQKSANLLAQRFEREALPRLRRATLPFYGLKHEKIFRDRTGVFLRVADSYFILTASHFLREWVQENTPLFVGRDPDEGGLPVAIIDSTVHTTDADEFDVAVIRLSPEEARILCKEHQPISLQDIGVAADRTPACFAVLGYPQAWFHGTKEGLRSPALVYLTNFFDGQRIETDANDLVYSDSFHVSFDFPRTAIDASSGNLKELPRSDGMGGISGCGIWRIADLDKKAIDSWRPEDCKLVAIQHRYCESRGYVVGTWVKFALDLLFLKYPELSEARKIWYPIGV